MLRRIIKQAYDYEKAAKITALCNNLSGLFIPLLTPKN
jgi:hypothetical protein